MEITSLQGDSHCNSCPGKAEIFKSPATIAFSAGRRRRIQMSDMESEAWRILGKRWTLPILKIIGSKEITRFNEIKKALTGISGTVLSERLMELELEKLISKNVRCSKIEHSLTYSARELEVLVAELDWWWSTRHRVLLLYQ